MAEVRAEYLEATLDLVKRLEISEELIRECVTVPGCCCYIPLLHNNLVDSCSYVSKNTLLATKGGAFAPPYPPKIHHWYSIMQFPYTAVLSSYMTYISISMGIFKNWEPLDKCLANGYVLIEEGNQRDDLTPDGLRDDSI